MKLKFRILNKWNLDHMLCCIKKIKGTVFLFFLFNYLFHFLVPEKLLIVSYVDVIFGKNITIQIRKILVNLILRFWNNGNLHFLFPHKSIVKFLSNEPRMKSLLFLFFILFKGFVICDKAVKIKQLSNYTTYKTIWISNYNKKHLYAQ